MTTPPYEVAFVTHRRWGNLFSSYIDSKIIDISDAGYENTFRIPLYNKFIDKDLNSISVIT